MAGLQDEFEKFAKKRFGKTLDLRRCKNGDEGYMSFLTQGAYLSFCEGYHQGWSAHMECTS